MTARTVYDLLAAAVLRDPGRTAVRDPLGGWTYRELAEQSLRMAAWLAAHGCRVGDRLLVQARSRKEVVAVVFGCARVGVICVPVSPAVKPYRLRQIAADAEPRHALYSGDTPLEGVTRWHDFERAWREVARRRPLTGPPYADPDDIAFLLYTSGSTGSPKGVVCPHRAVLFATRAIQDCLGYWPDDVVFCRIPLSFDYGLYQVLLSTLAGAEVFLAGVDHDSVLLDEISRRDATVVPVVPTLAEMLVWLAARSLQANRIRLFTNTGERLPERTLAMLRAAFPAAKWQLMFGTTECKRISIMEPDGDRLRPGSVGLPLAGTEVEIMGDDGKPVPPRTQGEIVIRGPHVMAGYWRAGGATARTFRVGPGGRVALHTGDFGYQDEDGYLYFGGRRDGVFKRKGMRTSSAEIEAAARDVPGVSDAVVVLPPPGSDPLLYYTGDVSPYVVRRELLRRLEGPKVPALCHLEAFPLSDNGKVDRSQLTELSATGGTDPGEGQM